MSCTQEDGLETFLKAMGPSEGTLLKFCSEQTLAGDPVPHPGNWILGILKNKQTNKIEMAELWMGGDQRKGQLPSPLVL